MAIAIGSGTSTNFPGLFVNVVSYTDKEVWHVRSNLEDYVAPDNPDSTVAAVLGFAVLGKMILGDE